MQVWYRTGNRQTCIMFHGKDVLTSIEKPCENGDAQKPVALQENSFGISILERIIAGHLRIILHSGQHIKIYHRPHCFFLGYFSVISLKKLR